MSKVRILSIDFDYFQDTTRETVLKCYPDGIDLPTEITCVIWMNSYCKSSPSYDLIRQVKANDILLSTAKIALNKQKYDTPVIIRQSHLEIWDEIRKRYSFGTEMYVAHVDFHDDFGNEGTRETIVDCGNWLYHVVKKYKARLRWYTRNASFDCYGIKYNEVPAIRESLLPLLLEDEFDMIFLCRSDPWTPPHLDDSFDELVNLCKENFRNVDIEDCVSQPRDMDVIYKNAEEIDTQFKALRERNLQHVNNNTKA